MSRINISHYAQCLVGKTIESVYEVPAGEREYLYWNETSDPTCVLVFTDGTRVIVMADPEGNGTGFLDIQEPEVFAPEYETVSPEPSSLQRALREVALEETTKFQMGLIDEILSPKKNLKK